MDAAPSRDGPRINTQITVPTVRLVKEDGTMVGVTPIREALAMAADVGLDLVEISPNAEPPVCKILDFGKFKYEIQKKRNEARKKQKVIDVKEIKLRPGIDSHDYEVKMRAVTRFLEEGDKVKVTASAAGKWSTRSWAPRSWTGCAPSSMPQPKWNRCRAWKAGRW